MAITYIKRVQNIIDLDNILLSNKISDFSTLFNQDNPEIADTMNFYTYLSDVFLKGSELWFDLEPVTGFKVKDFIIDCIRNNVFIECEFVSIYSPNENTYIKDIYYIYKENNKIFIKKKSNKNRLILEDVSEYII